MANFQHVLITGLLFTIGCTLAHPVADETKSVEIASVQQSQPTEIKTSASTQTGEKLRQEGDGGGDGGDGDGDTPEFAQVGAQVGQIITGVLGGNLGGVFGGATSFIQEEDTKSGVGNILSSISKPFNQLLISGVMQGQKFFGITDPPSILLAATTPKPPVNAPGLANPAEFQPQPEQLQPVAVQPVRTTRAPIPLAPPKDSGEDDDDESRADLKNKIRK